MKQDAQIKKAPKIITRCPDDDWYERSKSIWWSSCRIHSPTLYLAANVGKKINLREITRWRDFLVLHTMLLNIGGVENCFPDIEEDMENILSRGQFWPGKSKMMVGQPSRCHANSANLWEQNQTKDVRICTGYALSPDGIWRQHSWLTHYYKTATQHRHRLIETTVKRLAYFGFEMTQEESRDFAHNNY